MGLGEHTAFLFLSKQLLTSTVSTRVAAGPGRRVRVLEADLRQEVGGCREGGAVLSAAPIARTQLKLVRLMRVTSRVRRDRKGSRGPSIQKTAGEALDFMDAHEALLDPAATWSVQTPQRSRSHL